MGCLYALWRWCFVNPFKGCCCSWRRRLNDTKSKSNIWTCLSKQTFSVQRHFSKISILRMLKVFLFIKMGHSRPLFVFLFSLQSTVNSVQYKFCRWPDSNCGPLVLEVTALPNVPHHCPFSVQFIPCKCTWQIVNLERVTQIFVYFRGNLVILSWIFPTLDPLL